MEPRKAELTKTPQHRKEERKSRFQIVKLEERIAPKCTSAHLNPRGKWVGFGDPNCGAGG